MIVIVSWESVLYNLLKNNDKGVDKIFEVSWSLLYLVAEVVQGCGHDTWIFIAKSLLHLQIYLINNGGVSFMHLQNDHDCLLSDHLVVVSEELLDCLVNR